MAVYIVNDRVSLYRMLGAKTQIMRVLGPKYYNVNGIWVVKPYYLGPRTLRVTVGHGMELRNGSYVSTYNGSLLLTST